MESKEIKKIIIRNLRNTANGLHEIREEAEDSLQIHFEKVINYIENKIDMMEDK